MRLLGFALVLSAGICSAAPPGNAPAAAKVPPKEIRKTFPLAEGKQIFLESRIGDITIRPGQGKHAEVVVRIEADGDCAENKDRVAKTEALIDAIPEGLRVRTLQDDAKQNMGMLGAFIKTCEAPRVNYTLTVPRSTKLDIRVDRSTVDLEDMDSDLRLRMRYGRVTAKSLAGAADVDLRGGEVRIGFRKLERPSRIQMFSGMLEASVPKNAKFDLNFEGHPRAFNTDFPAQPREIAHVNGGGPRLDLGMMHGTCRVLAAQPLPLPAQKPSKTTVR